MTHQPENIFEHTGIRIMTNKNGDILFHDHGYTTGIRDYLTVTTEAIQFMDTNGKAIMWDKLMTHIKNHKKQPCNTSFHIPTND